ncbi:YlzJ-like family protein, partial [Bacillus vallismortis]|nr:YlzJ-like family protein [Bacillus vallismortis]
MVFAEQNQETIILEQIEYKGVPLLVEIQGNEAEVIQNMSTNPIHFLQPDISPGQKLKLN